MGQPISPTLSSQFLIFNILPRTLYPFTELRPFIGGEKYSTRVLEGRRFGQIESPIIFQPLRPNDKNLERIPWISLEDPGQERDADAVYWAAIWLGERA